MPFTGSPFGSVGGGSVSPGGADTNIQYNDGGALGGDSTLTFNKSTKLVSLQQLEIGNTTSSTTGIIFKGSNRFIHDFKHPTGDVAVPDGFNINIGINAGNFTMGATATAAFQGSYNINIGRNTGKSLTLGSANINIGYDAGEFITTAESVVNIGYFSGDNITSGSQNINIGSYTGSALTIQDSNVNIGHSAGRYLTGYQNVNVGDHAGAVMTSADSNVCIGHDAGANIDTGDGNICIGESAGDALTTGSNCVLIGNSVDADAVNADRYINIGDTIQAERSPASFTRFYLYLDTDSQLREAFRIVSIWSGSDATRQANITFRASDYNSNNRIAIRIGGNGSEAILGFFDASAITQRNHIVDADGTLSDITTKFNTLLSYLESYGLLKTS